MNRTWAIFGKLFAWKLNICNLIFIDFIFHCTPIKQRSRSAPTGFSSTCLVVSHYVPEYCKLRVDHVSSTGNTRGEYWLSTSSVSLLNCHSWEFRQIKYLKDVISSLKRQSNHESSKNGTSQHAKVNCSHCNCLFVRLQKHVPMNLSNSKEYCWCKSADV